MNTLDRLPVDAPAYARLLAAKLDRIGEAFARNDVRRARAHVRSCADLLGLATVSEVHVQQVLRGDGDAGWCPEETAGEYLLRLRGAD